MVCFIILVVQVILLTEIELAQSVLKDLAIQSIINHILLTSCDALAEHSISIIVYLLIT